MTAEWSWNPDVAQHERPQSARVCDYLLGGGHNFAADRVVGDAVLRAMPTIRETAASNKKFFRRAVFDMLAHGINQFIDLGTGIQTMGTLHDLAVEADVTCRVAYVDKDEVVVAHTELATWREDDMTCGSAARSRPTVARSDVAVLTADVCEPESILAAPELTRVLDVSNPVGVMMTWLLHFIADDHDPAGIVAQYRSALAPGSMFALSHVTADHRPAEMARLAELLGNSGCDALHPRPVDHISALFDGLKLDPPGVVDAELWHAGPLISEGVRPSDLWAGVGRK